MKYVVGLVFDSKAENVLLMQKTKPDWMRGFWNGIGGKIEKDEGVYQAMCREAQEEIGIQTEFHEWHPVANLTGDDFLVTVFALFDDTAFSEAIQSEAEPIDRFSVNHVFRGLVGCVKNVPLLVSLALDRSGIVKPVTLFDGISNSEQEVA